MRYPQQGTWKTTGKEKVARLDHNFIKTFLWQENGHFMKKLQCGGSQIFKITVWENIPKSQCTITWPHGDDMCLSPKNRVRLLTDDKWRKSPNDFWHSDVQISGGLFTKYHLWQCLQTERIRTKSRNKKIYGPSNHLWQVPWIKPHRLRRLLQILRIHFIEWKKYTGVRANECKTPHHCIVLHFYESRYVHEGSGTLPWLPKHVATGLGMC